MKWNHYTLTKSKANQSWPYVPCASFSLINEVSLWKAFQKDASMGFLLEEGCTPIIKTLAA